jgi:hypothetical protein
VGSAGYHKPSKRLKLLRLERLPFYNSGGLDDRHLQYKFRLIFNISD